MWFLASAESGAGSLAGKHRLKLVAAADHFAIDEDLWRGDDAMLVLEALDFLARAEDPVVDLVAGLFQHLFRAHAIRAGVVRKNHSVEDGAALLGHKLSLGSVVQ